MKGYYPGPMCKAEGDYVTLLIISNRPERFLKAMCTPTDLIVDKIKTIHCKMEYIMYMEYLPDTNCIVPQSLERKYCKSHPLWNR